MLEHQLELTKDFEIQNQISLINVHQDMAMIYTEIGEHDLAIQNCDEMTESIKKALIRATRGWHLPVLIKDEGGSNEAENDSSNERN
jgi:hypothetical protein